MSRCILRSLTAFLLVAAVATPAALAASVPVTVRVEGPTKTLVSRAVTTGTKDTFVVKDGDPSHRCPASSAAGALEFATRGAWGGNYDTMFSDYLVDTIAGVKPGGSDSFWSFWVNTRFASSGVCSTDLKPGDKVLFFLSGPSNPSPLALVAPRSVRHGRAFTVKVAALSGSGPAKVAANATVTAGGRTFRSDSRGRVVLTFARRGVIRLQATRTGDIRSAVETVRIT